MRKSILIGLLAITVLQIPVGAVAQEWPGIRDSIFSKKLNEERVIQVVLPPDYTKNPNKKFEVLYMVDGEWYMEQIPFIYKFSVSAGYAPDNIIVLIPNTYVKGVNLRDRDFSPTHLADDPNSGGADNFHDFIKSELIPYVEAKYRASGQRTLVGSSYGGLFCVYAFVKDAPLFKSYVASDPSLSYDNNYVSRIAAERLRNYGGVNCTLYISGLPKTFKANGIAAMDSVLKAAAPASIHFQCEQYPNETHYSVQHKAFYDGFRFSHFGYSTTLTEYHPMNGLIEKDSPLNIFVLSEQSAVHVSTDGTEPTPSSPVMTRGSLISIAAPSQIKLRTFGNRTEYDKVGASESKGIFKLGTILPDRLKSRKAKAGLTYTYYDGNWDRFPDVKSLKPAGSGIADSTFSFGKVTGKQGLAFVIDGYIEVRHDGYYIFYTESQDGASVKVAGQTLFDYAGGPEKLAQSYAVPLKKGLYSIHVDLLQKKDHHANFFVLHTKPDNDRWWETRLVSIE